MEKENVRGTLNSLPKGKKATFPITRASSVRSTCSLLNLQTGKKFVTKTSRADNTISVTRTA